MRIGPHHPLCAKDPAALQKGWVFVSSAPVVRTARRRGHRPVVGLLKSPVAPGFIPAACETPGFAVAVDAPEADTVRLRRLCSSQIIRGVEREQSRETTLPSGRGEVGCWSARSGAQRQESDNRLNKPGGPSSSSAPGRRTHATTRRTPAAPGGALSAKLAVQDPTPGDH